MIPIKIKPLIHRDTFEIRKNLTCLIFGSIMCILNK